MRFDWRQAIISSFVGATVALAGATLLHTSLSAALTIGLAIGASRLVQFRRT